jgi:antitoxin ParD1/3/4
LPLAQTSLWWVAVEWDERMGVHTFNIDLSPELGAILDEALTTGAYGSPDEIVREALESWADNRGLGGWTAEELRQRIEEGMGSGPALDGEEAVAALRAKHQSGPVDGTEA